MKKIFLASLGIACFFTIEAQTYIGKTNKSQADKLNDEYCHGMFKSTDGTIIDLLNENESSAGYLNILDWLQGRVAGLQIYTYRSGIRIPFIRGNRANIYVDEMHVDPGYLNALSISDIAMIKVIKGAFAGSNGGNSAVAIYTIKAEDEEEMK